MPRNTMLTLGLALATGASVAADRSIPVPPTIAMSWGYVIPGSQVNPHRTMGVGFWQRASGAKPGEGAVFVSTIEYQLPEAAPARVRSATFQFSGRPSQCVGAEPVVIDVYAYGADGKSAVSDASAGSRVAQLSADCTDKNAFSRPIDVTAIVRQQAVASGVRFVGFNIRKANNRQGACGGCAWRCRGRGRPAGCAACAAAYAHGNAERDADRAADLRPERTRARHGGTGARSGCGAGCARGGECRRPACADAQACGAVMSPKQTRGARP